MKEDKYSVFLGESLALLKRGVTENGRDIAGNSLRLMAIGGDVEEIKADTRAISEVISEMQGGINILLELNLEMKEENKEIGKLIDKVVENQLELSRIIAMWDSPQLVAR